MKGSTSAFYRWSTNVVQAPKQKQNTFDIYRLTHCINAIMKAIKCASRTLLSVVCHVVCRQLKRIYRGLVKAFGQLFPGIRDWFWVVRRR